MQSHGRHQIQPQPTKILLVDDHPLVREALHLYICKFMPDVEVHVAASVATAVQACEASDYRMALLDLGLANTHGLQTLEQFRAGAPEVPVIVLSAEQDASIIRNAINGGAAGYVPKSHEPSQMFDALRAVLAGGIYLPPEILQQDELTPGKSMADTNRFLMLTPRQHQVMRLVLQGKTNKSIARTLGVSVGTVAAHLSSIYRILGVSNRVEAVMLAAKHGYIAM